MWQVNKLTTKPEGFKNKAPRNFAGRFCFIAKPKTTVCAAKTIVLGAQTIVTGAQTIITGAKTRIRGAQTIVFGAKTVVITAKTQVNALQTIIIRAKTIVLGAQTTVLAPVITVLGANRAGVAIFLHKMFAKMHNIHTAHCFLLLDRKRCNTYLALVKTGKHIILLLKHNLNFVVGFNFAYFCNPKKI